MKEGTNQGNVLIACANSKNSRCNVHLYLDKTMCLGLLKKHERDKKKNETFDSFFSHYCFAATDQKQLPSFGCYKHPLRISANQQT